MKEIKTDLFPSNLYAARDRAAREEENKKKDIQGPAEPIPESERPSKDSFACFIFSIMDTSNGQRVSQAPHCIHSPAW